MGKSGKFEYGFGIFGSTTGLTHIIVQHMEWRLEIELLMHVFIPPTQLMLSISFSTDPAVPFVPSSPEDLFIVVSEEDNSSIIPCRTTDPNTQVTLMNKEGKILYASYDNRLGFIGNFSLGSYICKTTVKAVEFQSGEFFIYVYKGNKNKGIITLDDIKNPTQKLIYNLTIPDASVKDSGDYECAVRHVTKDFKKMERIAIYVHDKGFIDLKPLFKPTEALNLHEVKNFVIYVDAYPEPKLLWLKDNVTLMENLTEIVTSSKQINETREYKQNNPPVSISEASSINNVPALIRDLIDNHHGSSGQSVKCLAEGTPLPDVEWLVCKDIKKCNNDTSWTLLTNNISDVTVETHLDERNMVASQVTFQKVEEIMAVRCMAKNDLRTVTRELKLVAPTLRETGGPEQHRCDDSRETSISTLYSPTKYEGKDLQNGVCLWNLNFEF
ncbi:PREDICTED: platelet-derived growth factor receptor alpha-like [Thamnophis sirtalis]|uniref:Platelet-derived growth factor receptor alpha-like n=1 Tax=Thamnophis sirtalis TaxID=35019 RepID=A0A6I9Y0X3_9SAUR|nr:PREDICTED: platelet-derived growth factor receptor alpha-like [Thamnophis sirtalis]